MILVPFFVLFILTGWGGDANRYICLAIFVVASITAVSYTHLDVYKRQVVHLLQSHTCETTS